MAEFSLTYPVASDMGHGHNADRETETSLRTLLSMKTHRYPHPLLHSPERMKTKS